MATDTARGCRRGPLSLKGRALNLLAQREHSAAELRRKLMRHARAEAAAAPADGAVDSSSVDDAAARVDAVLAWLRSHHYLSEERFVESRVHARSSRYGNVRIRQELARHGIALPAETALALKQSELERAGDVWRRKFGVAPADAATRARQSRFLAQRGFSAEVITKLMKSVGAARTAGDDPGDTID